MRTQQFLMVLGTTAALTLLGACESTGPGGRNEDILLVVHPSAATLKQGASLHFDAVTQNADTTVDPAEVLWTSSDALIATVAPGGTVNALGTGQAQITAIWRGKHATADLSVIDASTGPCQSPGEQPSAATHPLLAAEKRKVCP